MPTSGPLDVRVLSGYAYQKASSLPLADLSLPRESHRRSGPASCPRLAWSRQSNDEVSLRLSPIALPSAAGSLVSTRPEAAGRECRLVRGLRRTKIIGPGAALGRSGLIPASRPYAASLVSWLPGTLACPQTRGLIQPYTSASLACGLRSRRTNIIGRRTWILLGWSRRLPWAVVEGSWLPGGW